MSDTPFKGSLPFEEALTLWVDPGRRAVLTGLPSKESKIARCLSKSLYSSLSLSDPSDQGAASTPFRAGLIVPTGEAPAADTPEV